MAHQRVVLSPGAALLRQARSRDASHVARDDPNSSAGACVLPPGFQRPVERCSSGHHGFYCLRASCSPWTGVITIRLLVNFWRGHIHPDKAVKAVARALPHGSDDGPHERGTRLAGNAGHRSSGPRCMAEGLLSPPRDHSPFLSADLAPASRAHAL